MLWTSVGPDLESARMKRLALTVPALLLAACGGATHNTAATATITQSGPPQPAVTQTVGSTSPPPATPKTIIDTHGLWIQAIDNNGTYVVGVDVFPGKYRNTGGTQCYWARLRGVDPSDVIDSKKSSSPQVVQILLSDTAFLTDNCGTWQWISLF